MSDQHHGDLDPADFDHSDPDPIDPFDKLRDDLEAAGYFDYLYENN